MNGRGRPTKASAAAQRSGHPAAKRKAAPPKPRQRAGRGSAIGTSMPLADEQEKTTNWHNGADGGIRRRGALGRWRHATALSRRMREPHSREVAVPWSYSSSEGSVSPWTAARRRAKRSTNSRRSPADQPCIRQSSLSEKPAAFRISMHRSSSLKASRTPPSVVFFARSASGVSVSASDSTRAGGSDRLRHWSQS